MIRSKEDFVNFLSSTLDQDLLESARLSRPDSKWVVHKLTNITFYFYKLTDTIRVGAPGKLPAYVKNNRSILSLTTNNRTGKAYTDNLCFFRCLALTLDCTC
jgi:hypothetical protein